MRILTPHNDPYFYETLQTSKMPGYSGGALVVDSGSGLFREVDVKGMIEYMYGGEYDLVVENNNDDGSYKQ